MRNVWRVFWRMGRVYLFYPLMIGLMIWIDYNNYHWIFGALVIVAIFVLDPMWKRMARNAMRLWRNRKN